MMSVAVESLEGPECAAGGVTLVARIHARGEDARKVRGRGGIYIVGQAHVRCLGDVVRGVECSRVAHVRLERGKRISNARPAATRLGADDELVGLRAAENVEGRVGRGRRSAGEWSTFSRSIFSEPGELMGA
jgi:hypothetical protein